MPVSSTLQRLLSDIEIGDADDRSRCTAVAELDGPPNGWLPGTKVHLFDMKRAALSKPKSIPWVASDDSMAYEFTERVNAHRRGESNTIEGRARAMTRWMKKADHEIRSGGGAQRLLSL